MLGIDHQHGRQWSNQPGADSGVFERQWRGCICGATAGRGLRLGGADAGATRVRELEACEQGIGPTIHGADDRNEPGATNATDRQLRQDGEGEAGKVSTQEIRQSLHGVGCDSIGIRGQGTREPEWASDQAIASRILRRILMPNWNRSTQSRKSALSWFRSITDSARRSYPTSSGTVDLASYAPMPITWRP